jgi:uncharacterized membrane protein
VKRIAKYFFQGLLFLVPLAVTVYIFYRVFMLIDNLLSIEIGGRTIRGLGFVIVLVGTTVIGFLTSNFLTKRILRLIEKLFARLPLVKLVYSSLRDLIGSFVGDKKGFDKPVLVKLTPGGNVKVAGFVTNQNLEPFGIPDRVAVYLPQSYNFAGNLLIVPKDQIEPLGLDSSTAMSFIISGGVAKGAREKGALRK